MILRIIALIRWYEIIRPLHTDGTIAPEQLPSLTLKHFNQWSEHTRLPLPGANNTSDHTIHLKTTIEQLQHLQHSLSEHIQSQQPEHLINIAQLIQVAHSQAGNDISLEQAIKQDFGGFGTAHSGANGETITLGSHSQDILHIQANNNGHTNQADAGQGDDLIVINTSDTTPNNPEHPNTHTSLNINGGQGSDTVSYTQSNQSITINLNTNHNQGAAQSHQLNNIENLIGTDHQDTLIGNQADNILSGGAGQDTLYSGAGNDTLNGGADNDILIIGAGHNTLDGGDGTDTVQLHHSGHSQGSSAILGSPSQSGHIVGDQQHTSDLHNIENLIGTDASEHLSGNESDNHIHGNGGIDHIYGHSGHDTLIGGQHNDTLHGGADNDILIGHGGHDTFIGGSGNDTIHAGTGHSTIDGGTDQDTLILKGQQSDYHLQLHNHQHISLNNDNGTQVDLQNIETLLFDNRNQDPDAPLQGIDVERLIEHLKQLDQQEQDQQEDNGGFKSTHNHSLSGFSMVATLAAIDTASADSQTIEQHQHQQRIEQQQQDQANTLADFLNQAQSNLSQSQHSNHTLQQHTQNKHNAITQTQTLNGIQAQHQALAEQIQSHIQNTPIHPTTQSSTKQSPSILSQQAQAATHNEAQNQTKNPEAAITSQNTSANVNTDSDTAETTPNQASDQPIPSVATQEYEKETNETTNIKPVSTRIHIAAPFIPPHIDSSHATTNEDQSISLNIAVKGQNSNRESLSILISQVPENAHLSTGHNLGNGTWQLTPEQLPQLKYHPGKNDDSDITLQAEVIATAYGTGQQASSRTEIGITVNPIADAPTLSAGNLVTDEDTAVTLAIAAQVTDADSESITHYLLENVPAGSSLSHATDLGNGQWQVEPASISRVQITPPVNFSGDISLTVTAYSQEANDARQVAASSQDFIVTVKPVTDTPSLSSCDGTTDEDTSIALQSLLLSAQVNDDSERIHSYLIQLPAGFAVTQASYLAPPIDGWLLAPYELAQARIQPPVDYAGSVTVTLGVFSDDPGASALAYNSQTVQLTIDPVADEPMLTVDDGAGIQVEEDHTGIALVDYIRTQITDVDGSERIRHYDLTQVPAQASLSHGNDLGNGHWRLTPEQLQQAVLTTAEDYAGVLAIDVTVTVVDGMDQASSQSHRLDILVMPVVDDFQADVLQQSAFSHVISQNNQVAGSVLADQITGSSARDVLVGDYYATVPLTIQTYLNDVDQSEVVNGLMLSHLPVGTLILDGNRTLRTVINDTHRDTSDNLLLYAQPVSLLVPKDAGFNTARLHVEVMDGGDTLNKTFDFALQTTASAGGADVINAGGGDDTAYGNQGDDTLNGGDGDDYLYGNEGSDRLYGGNHDDTLYTDGQDSVLDGGSGSDTLMLVDQQTNYDLTGMTSIESIQYQGTLAQDLTLKVNSGFDLSLLDALDANGHSVILESADSNGVLRLPIGLKSFLEADKAGSDTYNLSKNAQGDDTLVLAGTTYVLHDVAEIRFSDSYQDTDRLYLDERDNPIFDLANVDYEFGTSAEDNTATVDSDTVNQILADHHDVDGALDLTLTSNDHGTTPDENNQFTPDANYYGTLTLGYELNGGGSMTTGVGTYHVTPVNDAPVITRVELVSTKDLGRKRKSYNYKIHVTDVDDVASQLQFYVSSSPSKGRIQSFNEYTSDHTLTYSPHLYEYDKRRGVDGYHTYYHEQGSRFQITVKDPSSATDSEWVHSNYDEKTDKKWTKKIKVAIISRPIAIDLDMNDQYLQSLDIDEMPLLFDMNNDGIKDMMAAWISKEDAWLAVDYDLDGEITHGKEIAFAQWSELANTDLEGLQQVFDTNQDGLLDAQDEQWHNFGLWQDANQNGINEAGEFVTLNQLGITHFVLQSDQVSTTTDTYHIFGEGNLNLDDGSSLSFADAAIVYAQQSEALEGTAEDSTIELVMDDEQWLAFDEQLQQQLNQINNQLNESANDQPLSHSAPLEALAMEEVDDEYGV